MLPEKVDKIDASNLLQYIAPQDLKSFGLIPELIGRMPVLTYLQPLNREILRRILSEPKNSIIKQYEKMFAIDGIELKFEDEVLSILLIKQWNFVWGARFAFHLRNHYDGQDVRNPFDKRR
jgi:ATP-dependent Clp protease ATP-binding subunit ClpX